MGRNQSEFARRPESSSDFIERVRVNQQKLTAELERHFDFIVCGSGSSGSVVTRPLAENPGVSVVLLELQPVPGKFLSAHSTPARRRQGQHRPGAQIPGSHLSHSQK
jgi:hypothetical protein